jgi:hypothetical protein
MTTETTIKPQSLKLTITINMNSAAFDYDPAIETARILEQLVRRMRDDGIERTSERRLMDINGNSVGELSLVMEETTND